MLLPEDDLLLIAIDPGTRKCGYSEFVINLKEKKIKSIFAETIVVDNLVDDTGYFREITPETVIRYYKLRNELHRRFMTKKPSWIAYEGPFMNTKNPNAYSPLVSVMTVVRDAVKSYNLATPFLVYQPMTVKMTIGVAGKKGKEIVLETLTKMEFVMKALSVDIDTLDDNAVDSIVVGLTFFQGEIERFDRLLPLKP